MIARADLEIAWAAGLYEGEGCCTMGSNGYPRMLLGMCDKEPVERFGAALGFGCIRFDDSAPKKNPKWRPKYIWETQGHKPRYPDDSGYITRAKRED
jgi:hypothetical protein